MSLFDELKRRKVFKVGAAYLVVAWLVVQAASIGFSIYQGMILWTFQEVMPRQSPEFHRKLAEWGMTESWQRAEAWRAKNLSKNAP